MAAQDKPTYVVAAELNFQKEAIKHGFSLELGSMMSKITRTLLSNYESRPEHYALAMEVAATRIGGEDGYSQIGNGLKERCALFNLDYAKWEKTETGNIIDQVDKSILDNKFARGSEEALNQAMKYADVNAQIKIRHILDLIGKDFDGEPINLTFVKEYITKQINEHEFLKFIGNSSDQGCEPTEEKIVHALEDIAWRAAIADSNNLEPGH